MNSNFSPALFIGCGALFLIGVVAACFGNWMPLVAWLIVAGVGVLTGKLNIFN